MIVFKYIRWKNFLSTGDVWTEISLNTHGQTLIVGDNGAGKSTILDALSFALYGKPFRKINKGQLMNSINKRGLLVECAFVANGCDYLVRRGIKPNVFEVYEKDKLIDRDASSGDYQSMLDNTILRFNQKSFSQIVVLGSASFVPFMQLAAAHRREVIEDLLGIEVFTVMNSLLKEKVSLNKTAIQEKDYQLKSIADQIHVVKQHIEAMRSDTEEQVRQKQDSISGLQTQQQEKQQTIDELQQQLDAFGDLINQHNKLAQRSSKISDLLRGIATKIQTYEKDVAFFQNHDDCPTCRQGIAHDFKHATVLEKQLLIAEASDAQIQLDSEFEKVNAKLAALRKDQEQYTNLTTLISNLRRDIATYQHLIDNIQDDINRLRLGGTAVDNSNQQLSALKTILKQHLVEREELGKQKVVLEYAGAMLKDTGIKTKIIRQYVPVINKLINKYLASMDFFVQFTLNENFEEKIMSRFRDDFSYASFSEGEKSRIDLALLFTWRAIAKIRNSATTNLLILDEVFDGSLDGQGNEELLRIIGTLTEGNNVFVISHKTDAYLDKFERVLKFEKQRNFSKMVTL